ncbi:MAG: MOSC N-terminal beta barrel domain-containing protein [Pseudomonadales bacterium]
MNKQCTVKQLFIHPIKGCRPVMVSSVQINEYGVVGDRELMVVKDGKKTNLKNLPALAKISIEQIETGLFRLSADGTSPIEFRKVVDGDIESASFYGDMPQVRQQGAEVGDWISAVVGQSVSLVCLPAPFKRNLAIEPLMPLHDSLQHSFADLAPIMVVNQSTLDDLNERLSVPVPVERFRPNIVVGGYSAYEEDDVSGLENGELQFTHVTACERCTIINTHHENGQMMGKYPLNTLSKYRRFEGGYDSGINFGDYFTVQGSGTLSVGDALKVSTRKAAGTASSEEGCK